MNGRKSNIVDLVMEQYAHTDNDLDHISSQIEQIRLGPVAGDRWTPQRVERFFYLIRWYCSVVTAKIMIEAALHELPHRSRRLLLLRYVDRMTFREIADREGRSISTIRSWTQVAKQELGKALGLPLD
jgi:DNA-directed RNA polymerase specialized sigma24 family protein